MLFLCHPTHWHWRKSWMGMVNLYRVFMFMKSCDCSVSDKCPQGKIGSSPRCVINVKSEIDKREYLAAHAPITWNDALGTIKSDTFTWGQVTKVLVQMRYHYADTMLEIGREYDKEKKDNE